MQISRISMVQVPRCNFRAGMMIHHPERTEEDGSMMWTTNCHGATYYPGKNETQEEIDSVVKEYQSKQFHTPETGYRGGRDKEGHPIDEPIWVTEEEYICNVGQRLPMDLEKIVHVCENDE